MPDFTVEPATTANFDEALYLLANPDVALAVAQGSVPSGKAHFETNGRFEGRNVAKLTRSQFAFYERRPPSPFNALDLFKGEWSSSIPGYGYGPNALFQDHRVQWFINQMGDLTGKRVLELGPLEAGHTYMLWRAGANVTAIESNAGAYLKCLIVKEVFGLQADFLFGDFVPFLRSTQERYDAVLASGVLYHMDRPVEFLEDLMRVSTNIMVWTHYFDPAVMDARPDVRHKFAAVPTIVEYAGGTVELWQQAYLEALNWGGFCGGPEPTSMWLSRDSIMFILDRGGFDVTVGTDDPKHANGPAILFHARKR